jgi:hypothetical protein
MSTVSKDSQVEAKQLEQKSLALEANLVAASSEAPALLSITGVLADRILAIDTKEPVKSVQCVRVTNKATGAIVALEAAPSISANTISVQVDGTGLSSVCIEVLYRN